MNSDSHIGRHSGIPLTAAGILFLAALSVTAWVGFKLNESNAWVSRSYAVLAELDSMFVTVQKVESDVRGFVLTGQPELRRRFLEERLLVKSKLNSLQSMVADSHSQLQTLAVLRQQVEKQLEFDSRIEDTYLRSPAQAVTMVRSPLGPGLMAGILHTRDILLNSEKRLLEQRTQQLLQIKSISVPIAFVLAASGLGVLLITVWTTRQVLSSEKFRADELTRINQELKDSKNLFDGFMTHTPALTWVKSGDGRILWANPTFYRILELTPEQVVGNRADQFLREVSDAVAAADRHVSDERSLVQHIMPISFNNGSRRYYHISKFPLETLQGTLIGAIAIDIHDQYMAEEQVVQLNSTLQENVRQLELARDKALEASALKSAFVANISHEIRTPLSGIIGMNELLLASGLNADQQSLAQTVHESSLSLLTVLNDILDLSKIEAGKMTFELSMFKLKWLVQDSLRLMSAAAANKGLKLHSDFDPEMPNYVVGDPERVRQVLLNLIGNAVKFTERGSVTVRTQVLGDGDEDLDIKFSVSDTGIGIAESDKRYLFTPFAQVDNSSTRRFGGTGLGLTICKKLVSGMGGDIEVESEPGRGSTFSFTVPFKKHGVEQATTLAPAIQRNRTVGHKCVLVVEDNPVLQTLAVMQLTNLGVSSRVARNGDEALESVKQMQFDLILMDVHLPKMTGFEVTQHIRQMEDGSGIHTPIVAMTAGAMESDRQRCLNAGMDDYLSKPVSVDALRRMIEKWTGDERTSLSA